MTSFSDGRVRAGLNADGTFTLTVDPTATRDAILAGLLTIPAGTTYTGTPTSRGVPAVLLLTPPDVGGIPAAGGWIPRVPPAHDAVPVTTHDAVGAAITTLLAAVVLDLPGLAGRPESWALHDALGRLLRGHWDDPGPWRSPHPR
ncbi:hypothetical protein CC117_25740 [Parafrankia colletiae]|uniref:Uncharacterized protein n=1 Tax=Parafrankia colletiae TaxID=573497 RepID=A0A1S1QCA6_9ACTN|nr:hypothetical protein [Parafrankia colletiae]MCK9903593.1 hypothetical protein [Frankia sp. Cpl3]OHV31620.1 hypothetical protein CC117_25740 [Parafrankia colletiae]